MYIYCRENIFFVNVLISLQIALELIEVTSVINLTQGGGSWKFVYQIYPPPIDTLVTGMYVPIAHFEAFYPYFWGNISKLASPLKQWAPGHPEVR